MTNPPYKFAREFVEKALSIIPEGKTRKALFRLQPPCRVWVSSSRLKCAMNGDFSLTNGDAIAYAWFVWEKGYKGDTIVRWFN